MRIILAMALLAFSFHASAADFEWTVSENGGNREAVIRNRNGSEFRIFCSLPPTDDEFKEEMGGFSVRAEGIEAPAKKDVTVQIVIDGQGHAFYLQETRFEAVSHIAQIKFNGLLMAMAASKQKTFLVEFPAYDTAEIFSLAGLQKILTAGNPPMVHKCGKGP